MCYAELIFCEDIEMILLYIDCLVYGSDLTSEFIHIRKMFPVHFSVEFS